MGKKMLQTRDIYEQTRRKNYLGRLEFLCRTQEEVSNYFMIMAETIENEIQQYRHSWLIDYAFANGSIFSLDWEIIRQLSDARNNNRKLSIVFPEEYGMIRITPEMEEKMLGLYYGRIPSVNNGEKQAAELSRTLCELQYQLEQAQERKKALSAEVDRLKNEMDNLKTVQRNVQADIQNLRANALADIQNLRANALADNQNLRANAQAQAEKIVREANDKAQDIRAAIFDGIAQDLQQEAKVPDDEAVTLKSEVEKETRRLENTIRESLESYREELYKMVYDFRTGLYKCEYSTLCLAYQKLYTFATAAFDKQIEALGGASDNGMTVQQVQESLRKLQGLLIKRVTGMKPGLEKLGLTVFSPQPGEEYNDICHVAENAEDDEYVEGQVRYCVCPGIRTKEQILCRAIVMVDEVKCN